MSSQSLFYRRLPPTASGEDAEHQVLETATSNAAAASYDWVTALGASAPKGKCWICVEALTNPAYVRFRSTSTADTTTTTGWHLNTTGAGMEYVWYVDPAKHRYIDHISSGGAGKLRLYVCSPIGERIDI